jgi:predicted DNA-binding helix-hairpin-helix protein
MLFFYPCSVPFPNEASGGIMQETIHKLQILSEASRYDISCACATLDNEHRKKQQDGTWLYPATLPSGGTSLMLKTLISNKCINDCKYCPCRASAEIERCFVAPEELAKIFMEYVKTKGIFGIFLSSAVDSSPEKTMQNLIDCAAILRTRHRYKGYIHLKIIPGTQNAAIEEAIKLASAVSLNLETPGEQYLKKLSHLKNYENDILRPLRYLKTISNENSQFAHIKKSTQFIVGAADETDKEIMRYTYGLYKKKIMHRVYFSAYQNIQTSPDPLILHNFKETQNLITREHRLYQADFLFRKYGFRFDEIPFSKDGMLPLEKDPKLLWAENNLHFFPINVNKAEKEELLRVPGLGQKAVETILATRKCKKINHFEELPFHKQYREKAARFLTFN